MRGDTHVRFGSAAQGNGTVAMPSPRSGPTAQGQEKYEARAATRVLASRSQQWPGRAYTVITEPPPVRPPHTLKWSASVSRFTRTMTSSSTATPDGEVTATIRWRASIRARSSSGSTSVPSRLRETSGLRARAGSTPGRARTWLPRMLRRVMPSARTRLDPTAALLAVGTFHIAEQASPGAAVTRDGDAGADMKEPSRGTAA